VVSLLVLCPLTYIRGTTAPVIYFSPPPSSSPLPTHNNIYAGHLRAFGCSYSLPRPSSWAIPGTARFRHIYYSRHMRSAVCGLVISADYNADGLGSVFFCSGLAVQPTTHTTVSSLLCSLRPTVPQDELPYYDIEVPVSNRSRDHGPLQLKAPSNASVAAHTKEHPDLIGSNAPCRHVPRPLKFTR
jgi:hypothetical protein